MSVNHLRRRSLVVALATATLAGSFATTAAAKPPVQNPPVPKPDFTLTLLHANDQESALLPITLPAAQGGGTYAGAARFTELVQRERAAVDEAERPGGQTGKRGVLTISAGDHFLPGVQLAASEDSGEPIYDAAAFAAADWDVATFGNHDFDLTPDYLARWLADAEASGSETLFVTNNLGFEAEPQLLARVDDGTIVTSHVEKVKGERIGIIGLITPDLPELTSLRDVTVDPDLVKIANAQAAAYERRGVDKIVLVSHLQNIQNEVELAKELSGIDVIVGAGGGELLADPGDPVIPNNTRVAGSYPIDAKDRDGALVPVVTTTGLYQYVGRLVVNFDAEGELLSVDEAASMPLRVSAQGADAVAPDQAVLEEVEDPVRDALVRFDQIIIGKTDVPLDGVRDNVRSRETNLGNLVADALLEAGRSQAQAAGLTAPVVALQNGGGIRNANVLPAGDLSLQDAYNVLPFANFVAVAQAVPIETFVATVERAVSANQALDAAKQPIDALAPEGRFAQIAGFSFVYDASAPVGDRVQTLTLADGTPVVVAGAIVAAAPATISVASNDFSLRGGDGWFVGPGQTQSEVAFSLFSQTYQEALVDYVGRLKDKTVTGQDYPVGGQNRIVED